LRNKKVFFVGGTGRSGTTILNKILAQHSELANVPEWRFLIDPDGLIDFYNSIDNWSPYHMDRRIKRLEKLLKKSASRSFVDKVLTKLVINNLFNSFSKNLLPLYSKISANDVSPSFEKNVKDLIDKLKSDMFDGYWVGSYFFEKKKIISLSYDSKYFVKEEIKKFLDNTMDDVLSKQNVKYYLEKNTWNILWFDKILEFYPDAKMVHIYRDPRDVVASFIKQTWMPSDIEQSALIYKDLIKKWADIKKRISKDSYIEISLEELVSDSKVTLGKICKFYEIDFQDALLSVKLNKSNSNRWKKDFSKEEQLRINELLSNEIKAYGYDL